MSHHLAQVFEGFGGPLGLVLDLVIKDILANQGLQRDALFVSHEVLICFGDDVLAQRTKVDLTGLNRLAECLGLVDEDVACLPWSGLAVLSDSDKWRTLDLDLFNECFPILHAHPLQGRHIDEHTCLPVFWPTLRCLDGLEGFVLALECAQVNAFLDMDRVLNARADVFFAFFIGVFAGDELTCGKATVFVDFGHLCAQVFAPGIACAKAFWQGRPRICFEGFHCFFCCGFFGLGDFGGDSGFGLLDRRGGRVGLFATQEHHNHQYRGEFHIGFLN